VSEFSCENPPLEAVIIVCSDQAASSFFEQEMEDCVVGGGNAAPDPGARQFSLRARIRAQESTRYIK
jgi:hypothetical protein